MILVGILYEEPKVPVLQPNTQLAQKGSCWTWNQRFVRGLGSILTGCNFLKVYNRNLHNIARSDRIGFKTKNPIKGIVYMEITSFNCNASVAIK